MNIKFFPWIPAQFGTRGTIRDAKTNIFLATVLTNGQLHFPAYALDWGKVKKQIVIDWWKTKKEELGK